MHIKIETGTNLDFPGVTCLKLTAITVQDAFEIGELAGVLRAANRQYTVGTLTEVFIRIPTLDASRTVTTA